MISFIVCLLLLITGYLTYGKIVDKILRSIYKRTIKNIIPKPRLLHMVVTFFLRLYLIMILNIRIGLNSMIYEIINFMFRWEDLCRKTILKR